MKIGSRLLVAYWCTVLEDYLPDVPYLQVAWFLNCFVFELANKRTKKKKIERTVTGFLLGKRRVRRRLSARYHFFAWEKYEEDEDRFLLGEEKSS